tara:strand:- start:325 stop:633 length:309 start_codon:yes stop_codon:yes gene_type:complete
MVLYALEATTQDELTHFKLTDEYKSMEKSIYSLSFMSISAMVDSLNKNGIELKKLESGFIITFLSKIFKILVAKEAVGQLDKEQVIPIVKTGLELFLKIKKN